jgi:hypothetical protein
VRSIAPKIGVKPPRLDHWDIHVHVPEGATPKDGPSAGIAMVTSIVSVLTQIPVRKDIAMTGEVTLRGNVLPIGGLKEKLLAALRGGITTVLIPKDNEKDLPEIPDNVKEGLTIIPVAHVSEVLSNGAGVARPNPSSGTRRPRRPPRPRHGFRAGARARSRTDSPRPGPDRKTWKRAAPWRPVFVSGSVRRRGRRRDQQSRAINGTMIPPALELVLARTSRRRGRACCPPSGQGAVFTAVVVIAAAGLAMSAAIRSIAGIRFMGLLPSRCMWCTLVMDPGFPARVRRRVRGARAAQPQVPIADAVGDRLT